MSCVVSLRHPARSPRAHPRGEDGRPQLNRVNLDSKQWIAPAVKTRCLTLVSFAPSWSRIQSGGPLSPKAKKNRHQQTAPSDALTATSATPLSTLAVITGRSTIAGRYLIRAAASPVANPGLWFSSQAPSSSRARAEAGYLQVCALHLPRGGVRGAPSQPAQAAQAWK